MPRLLSCLFFSLAAWVMSGSSLEARPRPEIMISVAEQRLKLVQGGVALVSYPISTSRFGLGDTFRSYKTPVGRFRVSNKHGENLPLGAVLKGRRFTGEILAPNAPGRDPIVTRILQLQGLESQNRHALQRGIYIHGTPEERNIGRPVSYGCIRMRSRDVAELFRLVPVGTPVTITPETIRVHAQRRLARRTNAAASGQQVASNTKAATTTEGKQKGLGWSWAF